MTNVSKYLNIVASCNNEAQVAEFKRCIDSGKLSISAIEQMYLLGACHCKEVQFSKQMEQAIIALEDVSVTSANVAKAAEEMKLNG